MPTLPPCPKTLHVLGLPTIHPNAAGIDIGADEIVVSAPLEIPARRELEAQIEIAGGAEVALVAHVANAAVASREALADSLRRIGRGVVGDDQLEIGKALIQQRLDRRHDVAFAIVDGQR